MPVEAATDSPETRCPVRRSGRQPKRTDKLEEFLLNAKRASRKSAPPSVESGDPPSQTPTDAETASEASFDGNADSKAVEDKAETPERRTRSGTRKQTQKKGRGGGRQTRGGGATVKDEGSSENEEDSKDAVKNAQDNSEEKKEEKSDPTSEAVGSVTADNKNNAPVKNQAKPKATQSGLKTRKPQTQEEEEEVEEEEEEDDEDENDLSTSSSSVESDDGGYDPNALYCICRQKHNKRFMICCDRCEEWFHGDCVGITEARGRLMERNGEDYICPNCTAKKNQVVRPATSILSTNMESGKPKADFASPTNASTPPVVTSSTSAVKANNKATEDLGIKGRIEKATNPTGKKKIKIFQPQKADEESSLSRCIGPGCENDAQPDSVYCGNDCILRHAAAAMKSITDVKEPKQKDKPKAQKKSTLKKVQKKTQEESDSEDHSPDPDDDDEDEHAEEHPPPPATASWSSDHNYIAVTPEKTTPISPTVLNKKCMYLFEGLELLLKPYCCSSIINVLLSC
uniref:PHD-type domain-containing protein n=1 Tax=Oreochromis niloticus TaxID=8128 RepID=A0A669ESF5_ORENI